MCYFCEAVGHRKAACPMVKRRKVQPSVSASGTNGSSLSTTVSSDGAVKSVTTASSPSKTTKGGSKCVSHKVSHTASFAHAAKVTEAEARFYGECVSTF